MLAATTTTFVAHHQYEAEKEDELSLDVGDVITVSDMSDPGWWVGEKVKDGKAGWFPSNVRRERGEREYTVFCADSFFLGDVERR